MQRARGNDHLFESALVKEVQIVPIKPTDGVVGFASLVFDNSLYLGSIAIVTRPEGGYRLLYPTKKVGGASLHMFHPLSRSIGDQIEQAVLAKFQDVITKAEANAYKS